MAMPPTHPPPWREPEYWDAIRPAVWSALGLPPTAYADEGFFGDEERRLFGRS